MASGNGHARITFISPSSLGAEIIEEESTDSREISYGPEMDYEYSQYEEAGDEVDVDIEEYNMEEYAGKLTSFAKRWFPERARVSRLA